MGTSKSKSTRYQYEFVNHHQSKRCSSIIRLFTLPHTIKCLCSSGFDVSPSFYSSWHGSLKQTPGLNKSIYHQNTVCVCVYICIYGVNCLFLPLYHEHRARILYSVFFALISVVAFRTHALCSLLWTMRPSNSASIAWPFSLEIQSNLDTAWLYRAPPHKILQTKM